METGTDVEVIREGAFSCAVFPKLPAELDAGFCAKRHRKAEPGDPCRTCETGIQAAKNTRRQGSNRDSDKNNTVKNNSIETQEGKSHKEAGMAKLCSCGCGKGAVKDGLATKCYRKKYGKAPFGPGSKKVNKPPKDRQAGERGFDGETRSQRDAGRQSRGERQAQSYWRVRGVQGAAVAA